MLPDHRDWVAEVLHSAGITAALGLVLNSRVRGALVRGVNYHETPVADRDSLRRHLAYYRRHFTILDADQLSAFVEGMLALDRPGLVLTFDDGFRSNHHVAAEVLDEFGVKGFFFVSPTFVDYADDPVAARAFVVNRLYAGSAAPAWRHDDDFLPMSWDQLRDLVRRGHTVGCHGMTHASLGPGQDQETLDREIVEAKRVLEARTGADVSSFCWPFGTLRSYSKDAFDLVRRHYAFAFTTFATPLFRGGNRHTIDRSPLEPRMSIARVRCAVEGVTELYLRHRRRRFESIVGLRTSSPAAG